MRRRAFAPRFGLLLSLAGGGAWSACSSDGQDFFGNPGPVGGGATAGSSGESASAGKAGDRSSGGSSGSGAGEGGKSGASGSGGSSLGGNTARGGGSGDAGESGGGGSPPGGHGGEANDGAGMSGAPNEAGAPSHAGEGGDAGDSGTSGTGGNSNGGTSGSSGTGGNSNGGASGSSGNPNGGQSGNPHGGSNANGGTSGSSGNPNGGAGGITIPSCRADGDCRNEAEYCKKSSCAAEAGECALRRETCTGVDATFAPVCGCDGMTYFSACVAAREGTNIASSGECNPATAATCTRTGGGESCMPSRKLARCYRPRSTCAQPSPNTGTCWVLPDECSSAEPENAFYCRGGTDPAGCVGLCAVVNREDSVVREATECK